MSPASSLPRLSFLSLRDNELEKVVSLPGTTGMLLTDFRDNEISDLSPLVSMAEADRRDGVRFTPFWRLFLEGNPLKKKKKMAVETLEKLGVRLDLTEKEAEPKTIGAAEEAGENQPGSDEQNNSDEQKDSTHESKK